MMPIALLSLGLFFVFTALGKTNVVTSGQVKLEAGHRYRFVVFAPASIVTEMGLPALLSALRTSGAADAQVVRQSVEGVHVAVAATPPATITVTIGQSTLPGTTLVSVERLS